MLTTGLSSIKKIHIKNNDIIESERTETKFFTIYPALIFLFAARSALRNSMMYTSLNFESEEAARSQVERLQNQQRLLLGRRN